MGFRPGATERMAGSEILRRHWRDFENLRKAFRNHEIVIGLDRRFVLSWVLLLGAECPYAARATGWVLVLSILVAVAGAFFATWHSLYILAGLCALCAVFLWRFLVEFAVKAARQAVLNDERLFRKWFSELRLSIFVKSTGEYVWNDAAQPARE